MSSAVIAASSVVVDRGFNSIVTRSFPFQRTTDVRSKLVPVTVRLNAAPPAGLELGNKVVIVGAWKFAAIKFTEFELAVPVTTRTVAVPGWAISAAGMAAVRRVLSTKVVVRLDPFHCTTEVEVKFVPLTVRVNAGPPTTAELGLMLVTRECWSPVIVNVTAFEVCPPAGPGLKTVIWAVPGAAMSSAVIAASSVAGGIRVVTRALPFQRTTDEELRLVPVTVRLNAGPPAGLELGATLAMVGACAFAAATLNNRNPATTTNHPRLKTETTRDFILDSPCWGLGARSTW